MSTKICKHCGESFHPSKETKSLIDEGYIGPQDIEFCEDCDPQELQATEEDYFSDADPGL